MTILGVPAIPRGPLGDFTGRGDSTGVRPDVAFTRLGALAMPRGPLGDFTGRQTAPSGGRAPGPFTRLGAAALPRGPLGDFAGRPVAPIGQVIDVPLATKQLTPLQPSVLVGQVVDAAGVALVYYPMQPFIDQGRVVSPPLASLTLTPLEPAIEQSSVAPLDNFVDVLVPALLTLSALQPEIAADIEVAPPAVATIELNPQPPAINVGQALLPDMASIGIVPLHPSIEVERMLDVLNLADLQIAALAPRIEQDAPGDTIVDVVPEPFGPIVALSPTIEQSGAPGPVHLRQKIRQAAAQLMRDEVSLAGMRVYESRVYTVDASAGPYVLVYTTNDVVESASLDNPPIQRRLITLVIEAVAQAADGLDDVLDALVLQIEQAMAAPAGLTLGGLAAGSELTNMQFDMQAGAVPLGVARMTYDVTAYTVADTPQSALN